MALKLDGSVWSWGDNSAGQLGDGTETQRNMQYGVATAHDAIALVSDWQRARLTERFALEPSRTVVMRNAIAPPFERLFDGSSIRQAKHPDPLLAYTSTLVMTGLALSAVIDKEVLLFHGPQLG